MSGDLTVEEQVELAEPSDFWEQQDVSNQIAKFDAGSGNSHDKGREVVVPGQSMPMLVAVRLRPLWDKVRRHRCHAVYA